MTMQIVKNIRTVVAAMLVACALTNASGQANNTFTQYFQLPYLTNPGFAGLQQYTDIKLGSRQQWNSYDDAPKSYLAAINHPVNFKSVAPAETGASNNKPTTYAGIGGFLIQKNMGGYKDLQAGLSYAVHVPVSSSYRLSLGLTTAYSGVKADLDKFIVRDENDSFYKSIVSNNGSLQYFTVDAGLLLSSDRFMAGYSVLTLSSARLGINKDVDSEDELATRHQVMASYNHVVNADWEAIPSVIFRHDRFAGSSVALNVKARYRSQFWGGLGVDPGNSFSGLVGFSFKNNFSFTYSYEMNVSDVQSYSASAHELMIGISVFGKAKNKLLLW
ncbi:PorP/SprF family type IX secretion system membrane protein [Fulvivirgaceae bacterium PWU4]|uniref:PorP/SprF family type IX secretion system membrane protein n=1 Tax=Chryseosolibacter histidini TaxID=2782349 RepID=A0AAP2GKZ3_9BACT|nr:PorP/SprF family type IX secretion system membrane protein [Chryseosolibacter histidini]MBT1699861.1 PorP/SprF family type IX secretion system membrane protein [Chryseosolibacter histidini]